MHPREIDKYKIIKHLGNGHFGNVYLAHDRALDAEKAIKVLNVPDPKAFLNQLEEAQVLNKCRHKHIVIVNEANIYEVEGELKAIIDMEYLSRGSLDDNIHNGDISVQQASAYIIDALFALEYAHNQGFLHRDIKPANIMLALGGAKLSDFGLATFLGENRLAGSLKGYITHLAPEYFRDHQTTELTDVYAMGITLYRATCGYTDWKKIVNGLKNPMQTIIDGKLIHSIGYPTFIPSKIKRIINKACNGDAQKRFQSTFEMRQSLEKLQPKVDWSFEEDKCWTGVCRLTDDRYEASFYQCRKGYKVDIKKNGRRITVDCKLCSDEKNAKTYVESYVANSIYV